MKKTIIFFMVIVFISLLFTSCQKTKEHEEKTEGQAQKEESTRPDEEVKRPSKIKPSETKTQAQLSQKQPLVKIGVKEKKKGKPDDIKENPLTEEEQKEFERLKKKWLSPKFTEDDALQALKILVKADLDPANVRWYAKSGGLEPGSPEPIDDVCDVMGLATNTKKKETFDLILSVLKENKSYLYMTVCAAQEIKRFNNTEAIPYLRKYLNFADRNEQVARILRLEAAGSLLALGDADTALPALDELAQNGATTALGYVFHAMKGKQWEKKGTEIIKKAYTYKHKETKALAALFLIRLNEGDKKNIEETLTSMAEEIAQKSKWNKSPENKYSDYRILETIIRAFIELKSKKNIPLLKRIANHPEAGYISSRANDVIDYLSGKNGVDK